MIIRSSLVYLSCFLAFSSDEDIGTVSTIKLN
jgi:hypothetical protein